MTFFKASSTKQLIGFMSIIIFALGGCATSSIREEGGQYSEIVPAESVVILPTEFRSDDVAGCVHKAIKRACPTLQFFPYKKFVDSLFPWFEPGTAPKSKEDLDALLKNPLVQARIDELGVRYVISINGGTFQGEFQSGWDWVHEDWAKAIGLLYIYAPYYLKADRKTDIYASVFDLKEAKLPLKTESHKHKTHKYAWWTVLPLYIKPAITETPACNEIGKKIVQQLSLPGCDSTVDKDVEYHR